MCWSWKRSLGFLIGKMWEEMRNQWHPERLPSHSQTDRGPSNRLSQDMGRSPGRSCGLVQRHHPPARAGQGSRPESSIIAPHSCVIKITSLVEPTCCGRQATIYDRACKGWLCPGHHRERLCEFCQSERAWARVRPHIYGVYCEVWLFAPCMEVTERLRSHASVHPAQINFTLSPVHSPHG